MSNLVYAVIGTYPFPNTDGDNGEHVISSFSSAPKAARFTELFKQTAEMEDYIEVHVETWKLDEDEDLDLLYRVHYRALEDSTTVDQGEFQDDDLVELTTEVPELEALYAMGQVLAIGYGRTRQAARQAAAKAATAFYLLPVESRPRFD